MGQSFFDPLPPGADLYLLRKVLNDWPDSDATAILRRCAEAAGQVILVGAIEERDLTVEMLLAGGRRRDLAALTALVEGAGLEVAAVHGGRGFKSLRAHQATTAEEPAAADAGTLACPSGPPLRAAGCAAGSATHPTEAVPCSARMMTFAGGRAAVKPNRHGSSVIEFPNELEIVTTRRFDAPVQLVFDALTKPEHVRRWFAPSACEVTECAIDLRIGGGYHFVFVDANGTECSFRGTYLEVAPPTRTVETWRFEGWPGVETVESVDLHEAQGVTTLTMKLAFRDRAGRARMTAFDGQQDSFDKLEDLLRSLLDVKGRAPA